MSRSFKKTPIEKGSNRDHSNQFSRTKVNRIHRRETKVQFNKFDIEDYDLAHFPTKKIESHKPLLYIQYKWWFGHDKCCRTEYDIKEYTKYIKSPTLIDYGCYMRKYTTITTIVTLEETILKNNTYYNEHMRK